MDKSISEYFYKPSGPEGHRCGYCKSSDTSVSQGMWAHYLTVEDYQDLIDRGWRRSGKYCYKSLMSSTCCPLYTISCSATKFRMSKSQKRCAKEMNRFLLDGKSKKQKLSTSTSSSTAACGEKQVETSAGDKITKVCSTSNPGAKKPVRPGEGADPSKPPCRKAKGLRLERKAMKKMSSLSTSDAVSTVCGAGNSDRDGGVGSDTLITKQTSEGTPKKDTTPEFLKEGADGKKPLESFLHLPDPPATSLASPYAHTLEIKLVRSSPASPEFKATFAESYALYKKYQMTIHKDKEEDCDESTYRRFLCDSPLVQKKGQEGWPCDYGSYHQHYRIDGKLVAVGVIDILPKCLSSVYVYFDTDYSFLSLGVYSALREIELTRKLHLCDPERFKYYYMGYYVHSCQKMRYKANYYPSFLLCPESYVFVPTETCLPKLDQAKYSRLCDHDTVPEDVRDWLGETLVLCMNSVFNFSTLSILLPGAKREEEKVKEYAKLVGPKVAGRMLLFIQL